MQAGYKRCFNPDGDDGYAGIHQVQWGAEAVDC